MTSILKSPIINTTLNQNTRSINLYCSEESIKKTVLTFERYVLFSLFWDISVEEIWQNLSACFSAGRRERHPRRLRVHLRREQVRHPHVGTQGRRPATGAASWATTGPATACAGPGAATAAGLPGPASNGWAAGAPWTAGPTPGSPWSPGPTYGSPFRFQSGSAAGAPASGAARAPAARRRTDASRRTRRHGAPARLSGHGRPGAASASSERPAEVAELHQPGETRHQCIFQTF